MARKLPMRQTSPGVWEVQAKSGIWHPATKAQIDRHNGVKAPKRQTNQLNINPNAIIGDATAKAQRTANQKNTSTGAGMSGTSGTRPLRAQRGATTKAFAPGRHLISTRPTMGFGCTDEGCAWMDAYCHPCMEPEPKFAGIPDRSSAVVLTPCFKNDYTISAPTGADIVPPITENWDCQIIVPSIPEISFLYRARASGNTPWGYWNAVYTETFDVSSDGTANTLATHGYGKQRIAADGITVHHNASGTTNQGMAYAGQLSCLDFTREFDTGYNGAQGTSPAQYQQLRVPTGPTELVSMDPAMNQWQAIHGVYMPMRFTENDFPYNDAVNGATLSYTGTDPGTTDGVLPAGWTQIIDPSLQTPSPVNLIINNTVLPLAFTVPDNSPVPRGKMIYGTSIANNFLTGVIFFMGIDKAASLNIKRRKYMEMQMEVDDYTVATGGSSSAPLRPYAQLSPIYDPGAIECAAVISQTQPHAFVSADNDFGGMMGKVWDTLKGAGKHALNMLDIAGGLGVPLAKPLSEIGNAIASLF